MNDHCEVELVAACRRGDREAYAGLVKMHSKRIFAVCFGILGNSHDAEDVAQQALIKGFAEIKSLRDKAQFGPWIRQIARNFCIDYLRKIKHREVALAEQAEQSRATTGEYPNLQAALEKLPKRYRLPLVLYYFDGQSTEKVAQTLKISRAGVHTRLSRARKRLRKPRCLPSGPRCGRCSPVGVGVGSDEGIT